MSPHPPPQRCFWELTRACDHACLHCSVSAGRADEDELSRDEALRVAGELVELGLRRVVLSGGEPLLCPWWAEVARELVDGGVRVRLFGGAGRLDKEVIAQLLDAGIDEVALSLDGDRALHDRLRPMLAGSSWAATIDAVPRLREAGIGVIAVTAVSAPVVPQLDRIYTTVRDLGIGRWTVQLCRMGGRAVENGALLAPAPAATEAIVEVLKRAARERQLVAPMHCSVGWMTEEEPVLRRPSAESHLIWEGSEAGLETFVIDPRGGIRGCACLPPEFTTGSVRERSLAELWQDDAVFPASRQWSEELLAGACAACPLGAQCRAGCPSIAWGATGTIGANPYCLRVLRS